MPLLWLEFYKLKLSHKYKVFFHNPKHELCANNIKLSFKPNEKVEKCIDFIFYQMCAAASLNNIIPDENEGSID